jgi:hypothetical protein
VPPSKPSEVFSTVPNDRIVSVLSSVASYLGRLPAGEGSYPGAQVKGSVVRATLLGLDVASRLSPGDVPEVAASMIRDPPAVHAWVKEVDFMVVMSAVNELCFTKPGSFNEWMLGMNRKLLGGALYKVLFMVVSPERVFVGADKRWAAFHRGSEFSAVGVEKSKASIDLTFPKHLFPPCFIQAIGTAFHAAAEAVGAKDVAVDCVLETNLSARYDIRWR